MSREFFNKLYSRVEHFVHLVFSVLYLQDFVDYTFLVESIRFISRYVQVSMDLFSCEI